jgi:hypothetical protein
MGFQMFTLLPYFKSVAAASVNADVPAVLDSEFTTRNNHFIFTEEYNLIGAAYQGVSIVTKARLNVPSINGIARHHVDPVMITTTAKDLPSINDYREYPIPLPMNEEIAIEVSGGAGVGEDQFGFIWIAPPTWNMNLPRGIQRLRVHATYSINATKDVWSGPGAITFDENLKGGVYSVVGMHVIDANTLAGRLIFPRGNVINGRRLRPGVYASQALGDRPWRSFQGELGLFGRFHSFEPPLLEILTTDTANHASGVLTLDLIYMGNIQLQTP